MYLITLKKLLKNYVEISSGIVVNEVWGVADIALVSDL